jgi:uncharacterized lipoprotein YddW (UPF0748 family)
MLQKEEWYAGVNPTDPEVQQLIFTRIDKLISETLIDGIWLDFFRWPCHWESPDPNLYQTSFDERTIKLFFESKKISAPEHLSDPVERNRWILENKLDDWTEFKCDQIVQLARAVRKFAKERKSNIIIGLFSIPWQEMDFYGAMRSIVGQDLVRLAPHIDVFSPMVYHAMCGKSEKWISEVTEYVSLKTGNVVLPIIQSMDVPRKISDMEFTNALNYGINARGSKGVIVFKLAGLSEIKLQNMIAVFEKYDYYKFEGFK